MGEEGGGRRGQAYLRSWALFAECRPDGALGNIFLFSFFFAANLSYLQLLKKHFLKLCRVPHLLALGKGTRYFMCFLTLFSSKTQFFPDEVPKILVKFT